MIERRSSESKVYIEDQFEGTPPTRKESKSKRITFGVVSGTDSESQKQPNQLFMESKGSDPHYDFTNAVKPFETDEEEDDKSLKNKQN
jgi:hypothetical protein